MQVVLFGRFKFNKEIFRCENCMGQLVGERDLPHHEGHRWRPACNLRLVEFPRVLYMLLFGKLDESKWSD